MGLPSTVGVANIAGIARTLLAELASDRPDVIVAELGDGIIGYYGVADILKDKEILARAKVHVMCANDLVGAWGAVGLMKSWGIDVDVLAGPATDNEVGVEIIAAHMGVPAVNALSSGAALGDRVIEALGLKAAAVA